MEIDLYSIILYLLGSFFLTVILTRAVIAVTTRWGITDKPTGGRKIHTRAIALWGGVPIMFACITFWAIAQKYEQVFVYFSSDTIARVFIASMIILIMGMADDVRPLSPFSQWLAMACAALIIAVDGFGLRYITNPFGGMIDLSLFAVWGIPMANMLVFFWIMTISTTTKLLDGLDGLVTGIVAIGALCITIFSLATKYYQPDIALISAIFFGACVGFLVFNKFPARIFLGNVGSIWLGFILAVLAVASGGKIAIALLTLGVPLIDMFMVFARRVKYHRSLVKGDDTHLHFRLMHMLGHEKTVFCYWLISLLFGSLTLIAQTTEKMVALVILGLFTVGMTLGISRVKNTDKNNKCDI